MLRLRLRVAEQVHKLLTIRVACKLLWRQRPRHIPLTSVVREVEISRIIPPQVVGSEAGHKEQSILPLVKQFTFTLAVKVQTDKETTLMPRAPMSLVDSTVVVATAVLETVPQVGARVISA